MSKKNKGIRAGDIVRNATAAADTMRTWEVDAVSPGGELLDLTFIRPDGRRGYSFKNQPAKSMTLHSRKSKKDQRIEELEVHVEGMRAEVRAQQEKARQQRVDDDRKLLAGGLVRIDFLRENMVLDAVSGDGSGYRETHLKIIDQRGDKRNDFLREFVGELTKR